jgi:hypothetical protein
MQQVALDVPPPFEFWQYFDEIPPTDFEGYDFTDGKVTCAWNDARGLYQHVLVNSEDKNVFLVLVLDLTHRCVLGHRLLNLNREYGLEPVAG